MLNRANYRAAYVYAITGEAPESLTVAIMEELRRVYDTVSGVADLWFSPAAGIPKPLSWERFLLWGATTSRGP